MKWVQRTLVICLIAVLASSLTIVTTGVVVNAYIRSVLTGFGLDVKTPAPGFGGMLSALLGTSDSGKEDPAIKAEASPAAGGHYAASPSSSPNAGSTSASREGSAGAGTVPAATAEGGSEDSAGEEKAPDNALPVMGGVTEESGSAEDRQLVVTPDDMKDLKDSLPSDEKVSVFNILMDKVPQEEMQKISTAMEDGLTEEEVKEVQTIISKYVTQEEYEQLMSILTSNPSASGE